MISCDKCGTKMKKGFALNSSIEDGVRPMFTPYANKDDIGFIDCWKCPDCGRSVTESELRSTETNEYYSRISTNVGKY